MTWYELQIREWQLKMSTFWFFPGSSKFWCLSPHTDGGNEVVRHTNLEDQMLLETTYDETKILKWTIFMFHVRSAMLHTCLVIACLAQSKFWIYILALPSRLLPEGVGKITNKSKGRSLYEKNIFSTKFSDIYRKWLSEQRMNYKSSQRDGVSYPYFSKHRDVLPH